MPTVEALSKVLAVVTPTLHQSKQFNCWPKTKMPTWPSCQLTTEWLIVCGTQVKKCMLFSVPHLGKYMQLFLVSFPHSISKPLPKLPPGPGRNRVFLLDLACSNTQWKSVSQREVLCLSHVLGLYSLLSASLCHGPVCPHSSCPCRIWDILHDSSGFPSFFLN